MSVIMLRVTCPRCGAKPHKRCRTDGYAASSECMTARFRGLVEMMNDGRLECDCARCKEPIRPVNRRRTA